MKSNSNISIEKKLNLIEYVVKSINQSPLITYQFNKSISINWAALLCLAIFWLFALQGYPTGSIINNSLLNTLITLVYVYLLYNYSNPIFHTEYKVRLPCALTLIVIGGLVFLTWRHLNQPLWGDQLYHARKASRLGILVIEKIQHLAPSLWQYLQNIPPGYIIRAVNFLLAASLLVMFFWLPKVITSRFGYIVVLTGALLVGRYVLPLVAGSIPIGLLAESHPIFRTFPLVVSSAFFGVSDFGFRIASFAGYIVFLLLVFLRLRVCSNLLMALLATASIGTIPILWHVSYLVEQSVWSTVASASIFVILYSSRKLEDVPLVPLTAFVILATLLRSPAFIAFIPIATVIGYRMIDGSINKSEKIPLFVLVATLAVFVVILALQGSPATETAGVFSKWIFVQTNNISAVAAVSVIGLLPLFFVGFVFRSIPVKRAVLMISVLIFFAACCYLYYASIGNALWGVSRYQAEMFVPLIAAGITAYCIDSRRIRNRISWLSVVPLAVLIAVNCFSIYVMDNRTYRPVEAAAPPIKAEFEYPMNEAFGFIRANNLQRNTYYVGIYYGGFISVLRGYTASEYLAFSSLNERHRDIFKIDLDALNADSEIAAVIIESEYDLGAIDDLAKRGWQGRQDFIHQPTGRKMTVLTRHTI